MTNGTVLYRSSELSPKKSSKRPRIRAVAICVFRNSSKILVKKGYDATKGERFYRPMGGGVDFGEHSREAMVREIREELSAEVTDLRLLGTLENVFTYNGRPGHEIVLIYDARFDDEPSYGRASLEAFEESNDTHFQLIWKSLDDFGETGSPPLYPDGVAGAFVERRRGDEAGVTEKVDISQFVGLSQFGPAYRFMLENDSHAAGSVDRVLAERMIRICPETMGLPVSGAHPTRHNIPEGVATRAGAIRWTTARRPP